MTNQREKAVRLVSGALIFIGLKGGYDNAPRYTESNNAYSALSAIQAKAEGQLVQASLDLEYQGPQFPNSDLIVANPTYANKVISPNPKAARDTISLVREELQQLVEPEISNQLAQLANTLPDSTSQNNVSEQTYVFQRVLLQEQTDNIGSSPKINTTLDNLSADSNMYLGALEGSLGAVISGLAGFSLANKIARIPNIVKNIHLPRMKKMGINSEQAK